MMHLLREPEDVVSSNFSDSAIEQFPIQYRGWNISIKAIAGQQWLRWQHPQDSFARYGYPVHEAGVSLTVERVMFLIDLTIRLEEAGFGD